MPVAMVPNISKNSVTLDRLPTTFLEKLRSSKPPCDDLLRVGGESLGFVEGLLNASFGNLEKVQSGR